MVWILVSSLVNLCWLQLAYLWPPSPSPQGKDNVRLSFQTYKLNCLNFFITFAIQTSDRETEQNWGTNNQSQRDQITELTNHG